MQHVAVSNAASEYYERFRIVPLDLNVELTTRNAGFWTSSAGRDRLGGCRFPQTTGAVYRGFRLSLAGDRRHNFEEFGIAENVFLADTLLFHCAQDLTNLMVFHTTDIEFS